MATLTREAGSPGQAGKSPVTILGPSAGRIAVYTFDLDSSYAAGGEDISGIWDDFREVWAIIPASGETTVADQRYYSVDYTNKKLIVYTTGATQTSGDESAVTGIRLVAVGI
jgi:hypothetical protein